MTTDVKTVNDACEKYITEWQEAQNKMSKLVIDKDDFKFNSIKYVAGLDISFDKKNNKNACAYITIIEYSTKKIVYEDYVNVQMDIPYISGYLGFREMPHYEILFKILKEKHPEFYPDIVLVDGFGILHHRGAGSATHIGITLNIPTIGCGKTLLSHDGLNEKLVKQLFKKVCSKKGDFVELKGTTGKIYGVAYQSTNDTTNPIYISIGHKISLQTAIKIVGEMCIYRIPEPIRNSDIKSKLYLK